MTIQIAGCRSQLSEPHLIDPIYKSLHDQYGVSKSKLDAQKKSVEDLKLAFAKTSPLTYERVVAKRDLQTAMTTLSSLEQDTAYLEIRMKRREAEDRINYK